MGIFQNLNERLRNRIAGNALVRVDDSLPQNTVEATATELNSFIEKLRIHKRNRKEVNAEIDEMAFDSLIASAMELLADDATQVDPFRRKSVWIETRDKEVKEYLEEFLEKIRIEDNLWMYAYQIIKYGELYLKTYHTEFEEEVSLPDIFKKNKDELKGYVYERVVDPTDVAELEQHGFTVGFANIKYREGHREIDTIFPPKDYIHFVNDRKGVRSTVSYDHINDSGVSVTEEYQLKYGTSIFESARQAWNMLNLLEMLLLYVRFGRSAMYRLIKVEVGAASRNETFKILRDVKANFNQQESLDVNQNTYRAVKKPIPHNENIYIPVKQGKGDITVENITTDADISDIVDIDYWRNKLFAALKMPKAYLGFEETQPGGLGNISLTRQDIRYARSVKSVKKILMNGLYDMIDFHLREVGKDEWVGQYEIGMTEVMSAEASDIEDDMMASISLGQALRDLLADANPDIRLLTSLIIDRILHLADRFPELFDEEGKLKQGKAEDNPDDDDGGGFGGFGGGSDEGDSGDEDSGDDESDDDGEADQSESFRWL